MGEKLSKILKGQITSSVFYVLFGLCLILMPVKTVDLICKVIFGLVLIGAGCYHVYIYVRGKESATILDLFSGVIVLVLGGFLFYNPQVVVKLLPLLLGAFVLVDSIWTLQGCLKLKKRERQEWKILLLGSLIFIGLAVAMVINPFPGVKYTVIFAGWVFLLNGAADIVFLVLLKKNTREPEETTENKPGEKEPEEEAAVDGAWHAVEQPEWDPERAAKESAETCTDSSAAAEPEACVDDAAAAEPEACVDSSAAEPEADAENSVQEVSAAPLEEWKD